MGEHFRAFSFVDRIHEIQPGVRIRGGYTIPSQIANFGASLVAESVGQLAAWAAMAALDFKCRPVAGLAAMVELIEPVHPGQELELVAKLETVDAEAVAYDGMAYVNGSPVIRLQHCVGPMLPIEDFDDPQLLRERFALLRGPGAAPGAFGGVPSFALHPVNGETEHALCATLQVPASAPFFEDHFPRQPVFPGALLMHANLQLAAALATRLPPPATGKRWALRNITDVKIRAFTTPGEKLEISASLDQLSTNVASLKIETRNGKRVICCARVELAPEEGR